MSLLEGFVCKQGSGRGLFEFKTWKVRWCVVEHGSIKFYSEDQHLHELRNYSLVGASLTAHADAANYGAPFECVFIVHFSPESQASGSPPEVVICVELHEDMQKWLDAITAASSLQTAKITVDEPSSWLSVEEIKSLAAMLSCDNFSPIFAFANTITPSQSVAFVERTLVFLSHSSDMPRFIEICVERAMLGQVLSTLFRENNVYLRFIVGYMFSIGKDYLKKVIEPHATKIIQDTSLEVNPLKVPTPDGAAGPLSESEKIAIQQAHCRNSHAKIITIIHALLSSIDSAALPDLIVKVLHQIATLVNRDFPDFLYSGVVNVFFLRFIVASFCSPHAFGLCPGVELSAAQLRNLNIVAKVVQNIANGIVENKKEPYMQPLSSFVQEQQIFMIKFLSKVLQAGSSLASEKATASLPASLLTLSKSSMQDLQSSSNYWILLVHRSSSELPAEMRATISQCDFESSPMRDSIRGQVMNWSSIMDGKLVFPRPVLMSSLKPTVFVGDAFIIAYFNCWCKLNSAMIHGTMYVTRCAFIFIASVFDSFDEILVMRFSNIERIAKLNIGDVGSLVDCQLNRPFFLGLQSAICVDFSTEGGLNASANIFGITVDSNVELPIDGSVDASGKKSQSIFAAMYCLLSLSKNRQEAESTDSPVKTERSLSRTLSLNLNSDAGRAPAESASLPQTQKRSTSGKFIPKRHSTSSTVSSLSQVTVLQDIASAGPDDAATLGLPPNQRVMRRDSIRAHADILLRHINSLRNCYEVNFSGTRFTSRDPPILTRADWDAILPFICVMVFDPGQYAEFPDASKRYLLSVNSGSFAYCSGSKKHIDFFLTRGNSMVYEADAAVRNFAQLYACEPRSSLIILQSPLGSVPNAPEGLESRFIDFTLSIAAACCREMKKLERSLTSALQSAAKLKVPSDAAELLHASSEPLTAALGGVASPQASVTTDAASTSSSSSSIHDTGSGAMFPSKVSSSHSGKASLARKDATFTNSTNSSTQDRERFMQAVLHSNQSRKSLLVTSRDASGSNISGIYSTELSH